MTQAFRGGVGTEVGKFPTAGHFASWLGLGPDNRLTGAPIPLANHPRPAYAWDMRDDEWQADDEFDGGETGCGELLLDLRLHFAALASGTKVRVHALDAGAPKEIPAWCRLVKHRLVKSQHPYYLIEKQ